MTTGHPLRCEISDGVISISLGAETLKCATENHPVLVGVHDPEVDGPPLLVVDATAFAQAVERTLNEEREDGSTLVTDMLDAAIEQAIEHGAEGISEDWMSSPA